MDALCGAFDACTPDFRAALAVRLAGGKLGGRGSASAVCPGVHEANGGKLFFIKDETSNNRFLVDTGSTYCILQSTIL